MIIFGDMIALYNCTHSIVAHGLDRLGMDCHTALKTGQKIGDFIENYMILCGTLRAAWDYVGLCWTVWDWVAHLGTKYDAVCSAGCVVPSKISIWKIEMIYCYSATGIQLLFVRE